MDFGAGSSLKTSSDRAGNTKQSLLFKLWKLYNARPTKNPKKLRRTVDQLPRKTPCPPWPPCEFYLGSFDSYTNFLPGIRIEVRCSFARTIRWPLARVIMMASGTNSRSSVGWITYSFLPVVTVASFKSGFIGRPAVSHRG